MDEQSQRLVDGLRDVLGHDLVGVYLHGSGVLGGLRPTSDLDVIAVSTRRLTDDEQQRLTTALAEISNDPRPLDFDLVVQSEIRPWSYPPPFEYHYSEWWPGRRDRDTNADLAVLVKIMLDGDTALYGPPPGNLFDAVPEEDFRQTTLAAADEVMRNLEGDTRNVLLTLARIWTTIETGEVRSKDAAASWVLERLPEEHRPVLERARSLYLEGSRGSWDDAWPQVRACADYMCNAIKMASTYSSPRR